MYFLPSTHKIITSMEHALLKRMCITTMPSFLTIGERIDEPHPESRPTTSRVTRSSADMAVEGHPLGLAFWALVMDSKRNQSSLWTPAL